MSVASPQVVTHVSTPRQVLVRLCLMMFLQYFVQGCYLPIVSVYVQDALGFSSFAIGIFGSALAVGPLFAPFALGQLVDRLVGTQYVLAVCHLGSGLLMLALYWQTAFWPVLILATAYSILYVPSLMLTNSLAFHHLNRREREFPIIRLWGTIGFIVPAWWIELYWLRGLQGEELNIARGISFLLAGVGGLVMGVYCLTLPNTPPERRADRYYAPGAVMALLRNRYLQILVLTTFLVSVVHKFYFVWNAPFLKDILRLGGVYVAWEQRIASLGQVSEILVMAGLGLMLSRLGFKRTMVLGIVAYVMRSLLFVLAISLDLSFAGAMSLAVAGQVLHGFCFACFLAAAFILVDKVAPADLRGSMQNLFGTFLIGLGFFAGGYVAGQAGGIFTQDAAADPVRSYFGITTGAGLVQFTDKQGELLVRDWPAIWLTSAAIALLSLVLFALLFPRHAEKSPVS